MVEPDEGVGPGAGRSREFTRPLSKHIEERRRPKTDGLSESPQEPHGAEAPEPPAPGSKGDPGLPEPEQTPQGAEEDRRGQSR